MRIFIGLSAILLSLAACTDNSASNDDDIAGNEVALEDPEDAPVPDTPGTGAVDDDANGPPAAAPAAAGTGPAPGKYHCVFFFGGQGLQTVPGFTIAGSTYTHDTGGGGTLLVDGDTVEFGGGPLSGQTGKVEPGVVRLYNEDRSRTVIDCENK